MAEKPKHKPNTKHTLEEVLKSLHDLIRNDLVTATAGARADEPAPALPPVSEPSDDDFNDALDKLDQIITDNIIEPVERARRAPLPEIVEPDDPIEWTEDEESPADADAVARDDAPADADAEDIVLESPADAGGMNDVPPEGLQETFLFQEPAPADAPEESARTPPSFEVVEMNGGRAEPTVTLDELDDRTPPAAPAELSISPESSRAPAPPASDIFDADFTPAEPAATVAEPAPEAQPSTENVVDAAAAELRPPLFAESAPVTAPSEPLPIIAETAPAARAAHDDIPVLNEVAHEILAQTASASTSPEQIRKITIQVAARLNIELRQGGAKPLDARTINRLQQLLQQALGGAPKGAGR